MLERHFYRAFPLWLCLLLSLADLLRANHSTEAAAIAGLYTLIIILLLRLATNKELAAAFMTSAKTSASIMCIIGFTSVFNKILTLMQMPQNLATFTTSITSNKILFLLLINILLFLTGMLWKPMRRCC